MFRLLYPLIYDIDIGALGQPACVDIIVPRNDLPENVWEILDQQAVKKHKAPAVPKSGFVLDLKASIQHYGKPYRLWRWDKESGKLRLIDASSDDLKTIDSENDRLCIILISNRKHSSIFFSSDGNFAGLFLPRTAKSKASWTKLVSKKRLKLLDEDGSEDDAAQDGKIKIENCFATIGIFYEDDKKDRAVLALNADENGFVRAYISPDKVKSYLRQSMPFIIKSEAELRNELLGDLQRFVDKIEKKYGKKFDYGFKIFKHSQAINREINYNLAKYWLQKIRDNEPIDAIFNDIKGQRIKLAKNFDDPEFKKYSKSLIHSRDLNAIINKYKKYAGKKLSAEKKATKLK